MRISICNWSTTEHDIDRSAAAILRVVEQLNIEGVPPGTSSGWKASSRGSRSRRRARNP
jgi:hypothetical protein